MSGTRLIVFDLGRVLVRICNNWRHAWEVARLDAGFVELDEARKTALRQLVYANECGRISSEAFCHGAAEIFGIPPAHIAAMSDIYLLDVYPGVDPLIDELHARGYQTACLSNTNENHWRLMSDPSAPCCLPLERLTYQFASHLIGARKPDPAIYAHVEHATKSSPAQIIFFDDLPENIEAARARGWNAHQILPDQDPVLAIRRYLSSHGILPRSDPSP